MLAHKMMLSGQEGGIEFTFTVQTSATSAGEKKAAIPLNLYGQSGAAVKVDWGDGTVSVLKASDYAADDSTASVHEYASAGTYTVTASSQKWEDIYFISCYVDGSITSTNSANLPIYIWRRTLVSLDSPFPPVKGVKKLAAVDATTMTASDNDLGYLCHRCEKMTSIPADLFVHCSHLTVFTAIFYHCAIMTSIPAGLLDPLVNAVDLSQFFRYWIALKSVPAGLFDKCVNVVNMQETFRYCQTLETIPEGLFRYNTLVTNMLGMFRVCNMLKNFKLCIGSPSVSTVSDFIVNVSNVTRIVCVPANSTTYTTFNSYKNSSNNIIVSTDLDDCIQVEYDGIWQFTVDTEATASGEKKAAIPLNLYGQNGVEVTVDWGDNTTSTLTSSDYAVDDFTASVHEYASAGEYTITITSDDWENAYLMTADEIETVDDLNAPVYYLRRTLTSLDSMLPPVKGTAYIYSSDNISTSNDSFSFLFYQYEKLESIPSNLFSGNAAIDNFSYCFCGCTSLASIPSGLFDNCTAAETFASCFENCTSLTSIPAGLFDNNTAVTVFNSCFSDCTSLTSIPAGLFDNNTEALWFGSCFGWCSSLTSIPSGLFDSNTATTNFSWCFIHCSSLASIPSGLFDNNTEATTFSSCFSGCTSLTSIPSGLFDSNTDATDFSGCFNECTSLTSIPSGLFDNNTAVEYFNGCFQMCSSLASIPNGLFKNNTAATNFSNCFQSCARLKNFHLRIGSSSVENFSNFVLNDSNVDRILCVPANSTTYTTANNFANASNGIIVSTDNSSCIDIETWEFTINTEEREVGAKTTGIPFHLYNQSGITLYVDWGDGNSSTLTSANYSMTTTGPDTWWEDQDVIDASASIHEYAVPGKYTITVGCTNFKDLYIFQDTYPTGGSPGSNNYWEKIETPQYVPYIWWNKTLVSVDTPIPQVKGICGYQGQTAYYTRMYSTWNSRFQNLFLGCRSLKHIPEGLFDNNTSITSFISCFDGCGSLKEIPSNLFYNNTSISSLNSCFYDCYNLTKFQLKLRASSVSFNYFIDNVATEECIVCVPANTSTETNARSYAQSNKIIISTEELKCLGEKHWDFTIDTEASASNEKKTGIPFNLYNQNNITLQIDWGDGNSSVLTSSDYGSSNVNASIHEYANPGKYNVTISSIDWNDVYFDVCTQDTNLISSVHNSLLNVYWFRRTLISIDNELPELKGIKKYSYSNNNEYNNLNDKLAYIFSYCKSLQNVNENLFSNNTNIVDFGHSFSNCSSLQSIPEELFIYNTKVTDFSYCFYNCSSLQSIPAGLFSSNMNANTFSYCFGECPNILNFNIKILSDAVSMFTGFINNASNVTRNICVPANSSTYTTINSFANASNGVTVSTNSLTCNPSWEFTIDTEAIATGEKLSGIPFHLINTDNVELIVDWGDGNATILNSNNCTTYDTTPSTHEYDVPGVYTITISSSNWESLYLLNALTINSTNKFVKSLYLFKQTVISIDTALPKIKGTLRITTGYEFAFRKNNFQYCFSSCVNLKTITKNLFNNINVKDFQYCFSNCSSLQSIPSELFNNNTEVTNFANCFNNCNSLQSIPAGLFDNNTKVTTFFYCFYGCKSLKTIPSGLFDNNTDVTNFGYTFANCVDLQSIPAGLFDNNTKVTTFALCFCWCKSITTIPSGLFDHNTEVTSFDSTFRSASSITTIPAGLFRYNTKVTSFRDCFGCVLSSDSPSMAITSIPDGLFDNCINATTFYCCFQRCTLLTSIPSGLFSNNIAATNFGYCFYECSGLNNFTLNIGSSLVTSAGKFVDLKSGTTRTINVPANSTTYTTFSNVSSSLGLTIVGV